MEEKFMKWRDVEVSFATSYFYQIRFFDEWMVPVSICIWDPKWYDGVNYRGLVPKVYDSEVDCEACAKEHGDNPMFSDMNCHYLTEYRKQLSRFNVQRTLDDVLRKVAMKHDLNEIAKRNGGKVQIVFVGFEVPSKRCSERFVLADWLEKHMGDGFCKELKYPLKRGV